MGQLWLNLLIHPHDYPGRLEKIREGAKNSTGLGKRVMMDGIEGLRRRDLGREEVWARQRQGRRVLWGGVNMQEELGWV